MLDNKQYPSNATSHDKIGLLNFNFLSENITPEPKVSSETILELFREFNPRIANQIQFLQSWILMLKVENVSMIQMEIEIETFMYATRNLSELISTEDHIDAVCFDNHVQSIIDKLINLYRYLIPGISVNISSQWMDFKLQGKFGLISMVAIIEIVSGLLKPSFPSSCITVFVNLFSLGNHLVIDIRGERCSIHCATNEKKNSISSFNLNDAYPALNSILNQLYGYHHLKNGFEEILTFAVPLFSEASS